VRGSQCLESAFANGRFASRIGCGNKALARAKRMLTALQAAGSKPDGLFHLVFLTTPPYTVGSER
jgi:hypothetical protein